MKIKTALISVYDKTGLLEFAKALAVAGVRIVSTGQTAKALRDGKVGCTDVSSVTEFPEMLDGRVKTLHPKIHAGILARRDKHDHMDTLEKYGIGTIDMVVVSLYPFAEAVRSHKSHEEIIEMIDIGGPAMLRSAAKNHESVASVCDASDYPAILKELKENDGELSAATLKRLAAKVFAHTSAYDALVTAYLSGAPSAAAAPAASGLPQKLSMEFEKVSDLRYGENPHQKGAVYRAAGARTGLPAAEILGGKELSFNNYLDLENARLLAAAFEGPAACIMKHTNPCGVALASDPVTAYRRAFDGDPLSAFGGIVGMNRAVDKACAQAIVDSGFLECVIAPDFAADALELLKTKKNLRLVKLPLDPDRSPLDFKRLAGGALVQEIDRRDASAKDLKTLTRKAPSPAEIEDLLFAFRITRFVKSNAIVIAKDKMAVGLGMGMTSRVDSAMLALRKAGDRARGAVMASDGFFPKPDSIEEAARHGISSIIQPGGSIQDAAVIEACDKLGISMVSTGIRHFTH